jgi:hypothetical protein
MHRGRSEGNTKKRDYVGDLCAAGRVISKIVLLNFILQVF